MRERERCLTHKSLLRPEWSRLQALSILMMVTVWMCVCLHDCVCVCVWKDGLYHLSPIPLTETLITGLYTSLHHTHHWPDYTHTHSHTHMQKCSSGQGLWDLFCFLCTFHLPLFSPFILVFSPFPPWFVVPFPLPLSLSFPYSISPPFFSFDLFFSLFINLSRAQISDV